MCQRARPPPEAHLEPEWLAHVAVDADRPDPEAPRRRLGRPLWAFGLVRRRRRRPDPAQPNLEGGRGQLREREAHGLGLVQPLAAAFVWIIG